MKNDRGYDPDELERAWRRECEKRCELEAKLERVRAVAVKTRLQAIEWGEPDHLDPIIEELGLTEELR